MKRTDSITFAANRGREAAEKFHTGEWDTRTSGSGLSSSP